MSDPSHCCASASRFRWACRVRPVACICIFLRSVMLGACSESSGRLGRLICECEVFAQSLRGQWSSGFHVDSGSECLVRYIFFKPVPFFICLFERERDGESDLLFRLCVRSLVVACCALMGDQTWNPGSSGRHSAASCPAGPVGCIYRRRCRRG